MFEKTKNRKARRSFILKLHAMILELHEIPKNKIEDLVPYFQITTAFVGSLSKRELEQATESGSRLIRKIGRDEWNRTPANSKTEMSHVWVNPTGHFDEFYRCRSLQDLIANPGQKNDQYGFAKRPMDDKEFYFECFVKDFMKSNYEFAREIYREMTQVPT